MAKLIGGGSLRGLLEKWRHIIYWRDLLFVVYWALSLILLTFLAIRAIGSLIVNLIRDYSFQLSSNVSLEGFLKLTA